MLNLNPLKHLNLMNNKNKQEEQLEENENINENKQKKLEELEGQLIKSSILKTFKHRKYKEVGNLSSILDEAKTIFK